uniref:Family with sequence similarity 171 member B n=1 Tax=Astyanax mexicanus TaxID=7994 RepID=W5K7D0_ASTMX
ISVRGVSYHIIVYTTFTLRVQVKDAVSHQPLSQASVDVFVNYTLISSTQTSSDGSSALSIPYTQGRTLTLVASRHGYIPTALPWKTTKKPIFSSVTLSVFSQNQGNIWLFEDSVVLTGKISDVMPQPNVQFSKSLLSLPDNNISSLTAYLTGPQLPAQRHYIPHTTGIISSNIELNPVAAVSVQLVSNEEDIPVTGPIQITLPLPERSQSKLSDTIPAWSFNMNTGAWVNRGQGIVKMEDTRLVWVFVAPDLGFWIAAPFPSSTGRDLASSTSPFSEQYMVIFILYALKRSVPLFIIPFLCKTQSNRVRNTTKSVQKKNQTTSTNNECQDFYEDNLYSAASQTTSQRKRPFIRQINGSFNTCNIDGMTPDPTKPSHHPPLHLNSSEKMALAERLVLNNHPVAILQMQNHFRSSGKASGSRSAPLPRKLVRYKNFRKSVNKDIFTQTLPKSPLLSHNSKQLQDESASTVSPYGDPGSSSNPGDWSCFTGLLESVSVPETLNKAVEMHTFCGNRQRISEQTLLELSRSKPFPHPRAWFVSLEGKPAVQVRHSIVDLRRSHLLTDSNDTSQDSGVDLNEQQQCLLCLEEVDLSSRETETTTAHSQEDSALKMLSTAAVETSPTSQRIDSMQTQTCAAQTRAASILYVQSCGQNHHQTSIMHRKI